MFSYKTNTYICTDYLPNETIMRKLLFSVMALTIGALAFTSCDKEKEEDRKEEQKTAKYLSVEDQQSMITNAITGIAESIDFTNLAQVAEIAVEELGYPLNFDGAFDAMLEQDPILARKIEGLKRLMESEQISFDFESMYFEADIAFKDTLINDSPAYYPYLVKVNHNADRFLINIEAVDKHVYTLSLKGSNDTESRLTVVSKEKTTSAILPNSIDFSLSLDGNNILSAGGDYTTDFRVVAETEYNQEEQSEKYSRLTLSGNSFSSKGKLSIDKYTLSGTATYTAQGGLKADAKYLVSGNEALSLNAHIDATLSEYTNWLESSEIAAWAMDYNAVRSISINAALGGDQVKAVIGLKENPVQYSEILTPIMSFVADVPIEPEAIQAMVEKFNEIFVGEFWFKGYDKPQATFKLAYKTPESAEKINVEDGDIFSIVMAKIAASGLYIVVDSYDKDGKEITIPAREYFGKIDVSVFAQKVVANFEAAFGPLLSMINGDEEHEGISDGGDY